MHVCVLIVVALFILAGFWQMRRLDERRERNAEITQRQSQPEVSLDSAMKANDFAHRRVRAQGRYDVARTRILFGRSDRGRPGSHVLTPLRTTEGRTIVVDRGWVPVEVDDPTRISSPRSRVVVNGILLPPTRGIDETYLLLQRQAPPQAPAVPEPAAVPEPGEGSHRIYSFQWFAFAAIAIIGYGAILRRESRKGSHASENLR